MTNNSDQTLVPAPTMQPNGDEITDEMVKTNLEKYLKLANDRGIKVLNSAKKNTEDEEKEVDDDDDDDKGKKSKASAPSSSEKLAQALFADHSSAILKIDRDFPVEIISKLSVPTADKVLILSALKGVAERQVLAIENLRKEFASQMGNNQTSPAVPQPAQGSSPAEPRSSTAVDTVAKFAKSLGASDLIKPQ